MPLPAHIEMATGSMTITPGFSLEIIGDRSEILLDAANRFYGVLSSETGITVWDKGHPHGVIQVKVDRPVAAHPQLGEDESYDLTVFGSNGTLHATTATGALRGLQTLLQLVQPGPGGFEVPAAHIHDEPRFPWRGLMLDTSRHFIPVAEIERTLDGMEAVKLNVFHWHLSDDQGFRAEIKSLPLLMERSSDGLLYTQAEMREIVAYAADRGIRVVPEIDVPGHTSALLAAYPAIGSGPGPYAIERKWGIFNPALDPTNEATYALLDKIIGELAAIFPDAYLHIGGDECNGKEWLANPHIQAFMREHHLATTEALQAYFSGRVEKLVMAHGKIAIGWDEVLQPGVDAEVVVQSWHGAKALSASAAQGHLTILSKGYYLDLNLPAGEHYAVDPLGGEAVTLTDAQKHLVAGGEAAMWTEYVSSETLQGRLWPRAAAIAERLWSPSDTTQDVAGMYARLPYVTHSLAARDTDVEASLRISLQRIGGQDHTDALYAMAQVEQPPKHHDRAKVDPTNAFTPLNRLVDVISPESDTVREFESLCQAISTGNATAAQKTRTRGLLQRWITVSTELSDARTNASLLGDVAAPAAALLSASRMGLEALDRLTNVSAPDDRWRSEAVQTLAEDAKPVSAMSLAIIPSITQLVETVNKLK